MTAQRITVAAVVALVALSGCAASISGLGGSERLSCKAPEGVVCTSVSGVYANAGSLIPHAVMPPVSTIAAPLIPNTPASADSAVRRAGPRVLPLWIAPWEDSDGDLHEASTVHVLVDHGRWLVDPIRPAARQAIDAVVPPRPAITDSTKPTRETPARSETLPLPGGAVPVPNTLPH